MQRSHPQIFPFSRQRNDDCLNRQGDIAGGLRSKTPVVGSNGLEPSTSRLSGVRSNHLSYEPISVAGSFPIGQTVASASHRLPCAITVFPLVPTATRLGSAPRRGGDEQNRTVDPLLARQVLSQLSYAPVLGLCRWASPPFLKVLFSEGPQN